MANYNNLKTAIQAVIKANGNQEITGDILQNALMSMINSLGAGYQFIGVATPETNPGTPDQKVFYVANGKGTYANFGGLIVDEDEVIILYYDTAWHKLLTGIASQTKLTELESEVVSSVEFTKGWYSSLDENYRITLEGDITPAQFNRIYRINSIPSWIKKVRCKLISGNDNYAIAFYNSNSLNTSTFIGGVIGDGEKIYQVDIPSNTKMIVLCTDNRYDYPNVIDFGSEGALPKELAVAKEDIVQELGENTDKVLSQAKATAKFAEIDDYIDSQKGKSLVYANTLFVLGMPKGNVGDVISYDTSDSTSYHVILKKDNFTCVEWQSQYDTSKGIFFIKEDGTIIKRYTPRKEVRIDLFEDAYAIVVNVERDYRSQFFANFINAEFRQVKGAIGINQVMSNGVANKDSTGTNSDGNPYKIQINTDLNYRISVDGASYIAAKIRPYGNPNGNVAAFSFFDEKDTFINDAIIFNGLADVPELVGQRVPANAKYCIIGSRFDCQVEIYASYVDEQPYIIGEGASFMPQSNFYVGEPIQVKRNEYFVGRMGQSSIPQYITYSGAKLGGQGCAIIGNTLFRLYDRGVCRTYRIDDAYNFDLIAEFALASYSESNHCNSAQFGQILSDTGFPYLYVSAGTENKCYVEKVGKDNSSLVQTISYNITPYNGENVHFNAQCGDDGYFYLFAPSSLTELVIIKLRLPNINEGNVTLTNDDIIDSFTFPHLYNEDGQTQGGKIYGGKLYWLMGANRYYSTWKRQLLVFDIAQKSLASRVDLSDTIEHEVEDLDFFNGCAIVAVNQMGNDSDNANGNGVYLLKFS